VTAVQIQPQLTAGVQDGVMVLGSKWC